MTDRISPSVDPDLLNSLGLGANGEFLNVPPIVRKGKQSGPSPTGLDPVWVKRLSLGLENAQKAKTEADAQPTMFAFIGTNREWFKLSNPTTGTLARWKKEQEAKGILVKITTSQHANSPHKTSPAADDADNTIVRVITITDETPAPAIEKPSDEQPQEDITAEAASETPETSEDITDKTPANAGK